MKLTFTQSDQKLYTRMFSDANTKTYNKVRKVHAID